MNVLQFILLHNLFCNTVQDSSSKHYEATEMMHVQITMQK